MVVVEAAEVAVDSMVVVVADVAVEEAVEVVDEEGLVANVTVPNLLIGIDWTAPDDEKSKKPKR